MSSSGVIDHNLHCSVSVYVHEMLHVISVILGVNIPPLVSEFMIMYFSVASDITVVACIWLFLAAL